MGFYEDKQKRIDVFNDTIKMCRENKILSESTAFSISNQKIYYGDKTDSEKIFSSIAEQNESRVKVTVTKNRTFQAAEKYSKEGKKVCVLNFASSTNPGGGVAHGSGAQEECLCRCSSLYPALLAAKKDYHEKHIRLLHDGKMNALYNDDIIFTPDITVFKTDTLLPVTMPETEWYKVDIITCAAPNLRERPSNSYNPNSGKTKPEISDNELFELHKNRLAKIMAVAAENKADVLIFGAFGCGAFQNPPELVARAENEVIRKYGKCFKEIEFAVFCPPHDDSNFVAFEKEFR